MEQTTICALSTPVGTGGLAVIRVSGPEAIAITGSIFKGKKLNKVPSHQAVHGYIRDALTGETLDEVLALPMRGPHTFTGEDTVEIDCHGGMYICRRILESLLQSGCCMAERGEFSKRAFLNGRIDLNQAEAVMDMIGAGTAYSLRAATAQLGGALSESIEELRKNLLDLIVKMEVNIDYPEYDVPEVTDEEVMDVCEDILNKVRKLLATADSGQMLRTGVGAALIGRPNVGKSSWMNRLLGRQRAIVTDIPGTTRDVLEEMLDLGGIPVRLIDTAGLRQTLDPVEKIGVDRSYQSMQGADLVLYVMDASQEVTEEDRQTISLLGDRPFLILLNKTDQLQEDLRELSKTKAEALGCSADQIIPASALDGTGEKELGERIRELFFQGDVLDIGKPLITNMRQRQALWEAEKALERTVHAFGMPQDLLMIDIRGAYDALGSLNGTNTTEEIVTEIFSRFCLGK